MGSAVRLHKPRSLAPQGVGLFQSPMHPLDGFYGLVVQILEWVGWYNHRRLHGACEGLTPAEFEQARTKLGTQ